ncbi:cupin domain-containing protein [Lachnoclostridium phytofermentans]|uniref:Cupin 2 conserved barrel domain protein n=1 Tax=Lachnoclostridium phytofermentans (strain ATCC 700394 / DSM 18823 / ISDg) TaxID=357809 RepID=A9KSF1_LACP7|nr:cupin domain-containing protein [Lachnoclostridium phytofermentans]ABX43603.1 Cupin 2 conserved barrel domain protein [Lachnoclostridium phytofermentans ISDg]
MQELVITNVRTTQYKDVNLNKIFDPDKHHKRCYEFQKSYVTQPYVSGEGKLTVTFYTLQPGKSNYQYHQHTGTEEVFYIICGTATLKTPKGDVIVTEGDVIVFPPNENGAHMLTNHSAEPLVYLDVHTISSPEVIIYPDSGNVRVMAGNTQKSYKIESEVNYLDGE